MKRYIKSTELPKSFGYGPTMKYDGERIKKTRLTDAGRIVYEDVEKTREDGSKKLYYKYRNHLHGTYYPYCFDPETPEREYEFERGMFL